MAPPSLPAERRRLLARERGHAALEILGAAAGGDRLRLQLHLGLEALPRRLMEQPLGAAERLFHQSTWESLETQMELEAQAIAASGRTEDFKSGVTAFARKQAPTFRGK